MPERHDRQMQHQTQTLRSGYFDRSAYRKKRRTLLVLQTGVAGLRFNLDLETEEGRAVLASLTPGTELRLFRDPDNAYDPWAISVYSPDGLMLGYVSRYKNETIARLMDCGKAFKAYVDERSVPRPGETDSSPAALSKAPTEDLRLPFSIYLEECL